MVFYHTVRHLYLKSLFPYLQEVVVYTRSELSDKWRLLKNESEKVENKHQIESMVWYQINGSITTKQLADPTNTDATQEEAAHSVLQGFATKFIKHTVKNNSFLRSFQVMEEFTVCKNVMEKRKLFFDDNGLPRKNFL
ncbi:uncharacterized protein FA14DRAFT_154115 [Meira miltonrushii]|uniref:Uncharacterized protein n=1 Tax=Meira miltonrushii TaxID=1280837 RepID=A0A316VEE7_9BASI|nr:uncharacterized protein FA14DRAFT_154115 [Meira miltonrushii]PWN34663.1 hypothetical protein FA14DRAFT_154115 [Meira miltonrushii]